MKIWKREWVFWLAALLVLSGAAGVAWLTAHPSAPIVDENGETLGVCYVDKLDDGPPFRADDLSYLMALSSIAAAAMGRGPH